MTIAEVSELYNVSSATLRYYERIGLIPPVTRKENGIRDFQQEDLNWVEFAIKMRDAGISIEILIEYVTLFKMGKDTIPTRKALLIEQRESLAKKMEILQNTIDRLDQKIEGYETRVLKYEERLKWNFNFFHFIDNKW